ncbi:MAG: response regulator [Dehalococcoidales bacterium]|nr:response regulator [Dehalococcoidales bacterium]
MKRSRHFSPARLLLADHNAQDRMALQDCLKREAFLVREVVDGWSLLSDLKREIPHLIVLDLQLPPIDGMELCHRIKS